MRSFISRTVLNSFVLDFKSHGLSELSKSGKAKSVTSFKFLQLMKSTFDYCRHQC